MVVAYHGGRVHGLDGLDGLDVLDVLDVLDLLPVRRLRETCPCQVASRGAWRRVEEQVGRHLAEAYLQNNRKSQAFLSILVH